MAWFCRFLFIRAGALLSMLFLGVKGMCRTLFFAERLAEALQLFFAFFTGTSRKGLSVS
jgi:hypothetical protein